MSILKADYDDNYPVPVHVREPSDPAERTRLLAEASASIEDGHGIPHEKVATWLLDLAAGHPAKVPCDL